MFVLEPDTLKAQTVNLGHSKMNVRTIKLYYLAPVDISWAPEFDIKYQTTFLENLLQQFGKDQDILKEVINFDYLYTLKSRDSAEQNSYIKELIFEVIIHIKER